jgi:hypothetical protein
VFSTGILEPQAGESNRVPKCFTAPAAQ